MSDMTFVLLAIIGVSVATAVPLIAYALLPQQALASAAEHGRFGGLGPAEKTERPSGNSALPAAGAVAEPSC